MRSRVGLYAQPHQFLNGEISGTTVSAERQSVSADGYLSHDCWLKPVPYGLAGNAYFSLSPLSALPARNGSMTATMSSTGHIRHRIAYNEYIHWLVRTRRALPNQACRSLSICACRHAGGVPSNLVRTKAVNFIEACAESGKTTLAILRESVRSSPRL